MGRPSTYTPELAAVICERLADGESLKAICASENMPNRSTIWRWLDANEDFRSMYARAREGQAETLADEIVAIADSDDDPRSRAVRVDARKWIAAKLRPRAYGDRHQLEHSGPGGSAIPLAVSVEFVNSGTNT